MSAHNSDSPSRDSGTPAQATAQVPEQDGLTLTTLPGPVLVTGAKGFLGRHLVHALGGQARAYGHESLDITSRPAIEHILRIEKPWAVINSAALADVDRCDREPARAWHINASGAASLAELCAALGIRLLHVSTDYVYDGTLDRRYRVTDPTEPLNHYGATKAEAEKAVLKAHPQAIIARVAWLFGPFGAGFAGQLPYQLARGETVQAIYDRLGHPTYVVDAAQRILALLGLGVPGIYHVVNQGPASWYAFASRLAERLGLPSTQVQSVSRLELPPRSPRPVQIRLEEDPRRPGVSFPPLRHWQEAQDAWLRTLVLMAGQSVEAQKAKEKAGR